MGTINRYEQRLIAVSRWASLGSAIAGLLVLGGWIFGIPILKSMLPGFVEMKANTAIGFILAGTSLSLYHQGPKWHKVSLICTLPLLAIALLTLGEYLLHVDFHIDEWLFNDLNNDNTRSFPGRMAPVTALCQAVLGLGLILLASPGRTARNSVVICASTSVALGSIAVLGYLYDVSALYTITAYTSMALHTALLCLIMGVALLCALPRHPPTQLLTLEDAGGHMARIMLPMVTFTPALLGFFLNMGVRSNLLPASFAVAMFATITIFIFVLLVWLAAFTLQKAEAARYQVQQVSDWQEAILNSADLTIISTDPSGTILTCNAGALKQLGYRAEEIIGNVSLTAFHDPAELAAKAVDLSRERGSVITPGIAALTTIARTGQPDENEWTYIRKDGSRLSVQLAVTPLFDHKDRLSGFLAIGRDISLRKRHERHIREQQQTIDQANRENQSILDYAGCSIISTELNGIIRSFNKGAEHLLGYQAAEMIGTHTPEAFHDAEEAASRAKQLSVELKRPVAPGFEAFVIKTHFQEQPDENEWTYIRKDGSRVPVLVTVTAQRDAENRIIGYLGIGIDITERKRLDRMKNEFVSTVSHELRTPLTSIRGALGLVLGKASENLPEKTRILLETANRNSERLAFLINDILDLEKIESGILAFSMANRDLVVVARQALAGNESYAEQHAVTLRLIEVPETAFILGDENRLLQVFSNLLSNAVKYSPAGGTVDVSIRPVGKGYRVSVRDHGPGIPAAFRPRLFQRFAQADGSDSRARGGTGLGLSITKAIIDRHDGIIGYHTEEGSGTEFYFDIPALKDDQPLITPEVLRPRMLICEDNADLAEVMAELLDAEGFACDIVHTGGQARELLAGRGYRAILLDLTLPDIGGLELARELRDDSALRSLPVIVVSGHISGHAPNMPADLDNVTGWLQKPLEFPRFREALQRAMAKVRRPQILHLEDEQDIRQITQALVEGFADYTPARNLAEARRWLAQRRFDLILIDINLPDGCGLDLLDNIDARETATVVFSGQDAPPEAAARVTAILTKSRTSNAELLAALKRILGA